MNLFNRLRLRWLHLWCLVLKRPASASAVAFLNRADVILFYNREWPHPWGAPVVGGGLIYLGRCTYREALRELGRVQPGSSVIHTDYQNHFIFIAK